MMRTWEEKVKFRFGNYTDHDTEDRTYDVIVPGVSDNPSVQDNIHTMTTYVVYSFS
jgi:hypothetical protein